MILANTELRSYSYIVLRGSAMLMPYGVAEDEVEDEDKVLIDASKSFGTISLPPKVAEFADKEREKTEEQDRLRRADEMRRLAEAKRKAKLEGKDPTTVTIEKEKQKPKAGPDGVSELWRVTWSPRAEYLSVSNGDLGDVLKIVEETILKKQMMDDMNDGDDCKDEENQEDTKQKMHEYRAGSVLYTQG